MLTLDAQVHAYEPNHPGRPWVGTLHGPAEVTGDQMVAAMDAVGVDGAVLESPFSMYRYDASYAKEVYTAHPDRFALVKPSIRPTPQSPIRSPIGLPPTARSASGCSCETMFRPTRPIPASIMFWSLRRSTPWRSI